MPEGDRMKICVSAVSDSLDAEVDPRFGRCPYFAIVDTETMAFESIPNTASSSMGGAGIQAAQLVADRGAKVLITGNIGPNAFQALSAANIKVITGAFGSVREAIEKYKSGELKETGAPSVRGHFGRGRRRSW